MPKPTGPNRHSLKRTRMHLLDAATRCFSEHGYKGTSTTMIIKEAKSSRGTLYHHFLDKNAIFKAVYDDLSQTVLDLIQNYPYKGNQLIENLIDGCVVYLEAFTDHKFAQIVLIDAPYVLGLDYCRSKDAETVYKALHSGVHHIVKDDKKTRLVVDFLSGALDTYALRIALSNDRQKMFTVYASGFRHLAKGILEDRSF